MDCKVGLSCAFVALVAMSGCARAVHVAVREAAPQAEHATLASLFVPTELDAVDSEAGKHASVSDESIAVLDRLRTNTKPQPRLPEHVATALPFACVVPNPIGICATPPAAR